MMEWANQKVIFGGAKLITIYHIFIEQIVACSLLDLHYL